MPDPISSVVLAGAASGAAGKFIEKTYDSGTKWLSELYKNHHAKATESAKVNSDDFLRVLARKVHALEEESELNTSIINAALEDPHFGALIQKSIHASSQTSNKDRHELLAMLISGRIKSESESMYAMASQSACDVISNITVRQMRILAIIAVITMIVPVGISEVSFNSRDAYCVYCDTWLSPMLAIAIEIQTNNFDYKHLEAMSCAKLSLGSYNLNALLEEKFKHPAMPAYNQDDLVKTEKGRQFLDFWNTRGLKSLELTTIGQIIGILTYDSIVGKSTRLDALYRA